MASKSDIAVSVRSLSKAYTIAHQGEKHVTLAEAILARVKDPFRNVQKETFWALKDVNFDIKKGDVVGIIGRNGAGKSTLLKILSRITEPTTGQIDLYGRVGSLLEVGTGFHPELTGRENVFLNGAILGMSKAEIRKQFDAIVDFAGVEKFLDTPVKRYSSGMYVRLAFAVAAHLQSEILMVDEVLAVGDAQFQNKCLGKMQDVGASGRTVLFVSHSMPMIQRLCHTGILLESGRIAFVGTASDTAGRYMSGGGSGSNERAWPDSELAPGDDNARLLGIKLLDRTGNARGQFDVREPVIVSISYRCKDCGSSPIAAIHVVNQTGIVLFASADFACQSRNTANGDSSLIRSACIIPGDFLAEGEFSIVVALVSYNPNIVHALERDVVSFTTVDQSEGDGVRGTAANNWPGVLRPRLDWINPHDLSPSALA